MTTQKLIERLTPIDLDFFKKRCRFRIKPRHVIVAFGDTWGFREWEELRVVSSWEVWKFIETLYQEFADIRNGDGFFIKPMGDGLMVVVELPKDAQERSQHVKQLLRRSYRLVKSVERHIKKLPYPRPRGFRMRLVAGTVGRLEVMDALDPLKRMVDYTGAPVSLAFNLLDVERRKSCLCHTNVKALLDILEEKKPEIDFRYVRNPANSVRKITKRDLRSLWEFSVQK